MYLLIAPIKKELWATTKTKSEYYNKNGWKFVDIQFVDNINICI